MAVKKRGYLLLLTLLIMAITVGCKDKSQLILYDYSHKEITELPSSPNDSEIKRILESIGNVGEVEESDDTEDTE